MKPMRFGMCGCGGIAGLHADCLRNLEKAGLAKLVAGCEPDAGRRGAFAAKWGVPVVPTLEELLRRDDVDAVTVCSPSGLHGRQCVAVAESGRHVLCEKPLDLRLADADAAVEAAARHGVVLGGIFQQRFAPGPLKVKCAVDRGLLGRIVFVHCETPWYRTQEYYDSGDWRGTWDLDCGVLANQSPHMIDRLLWLGGDVAEVVSAVCEPGFERDIEAETLAVATVRLVNGARAPSPPPPSPTTASPSASSSAGPTAPPLSPATTSSISKPASRWKTTPRPRRRRTPATAAAIRWPCPPTATWATSATSSSPSPRGESRWSRGRPTPGDPRAEPHLRKSGGGAVREEWFATDEDRWTQMKTRGRGETRSPKPE